MIAVWPSMPPATQAKAAMRSGSISAVSDGVMSSATTIVPSARSLKARNGVRVRLRSSRPPISRTSAARAAVAVASTRAIGRGMNVAALAASSSSTSGRPAIRAYRSSVPGRTGAPISTRSDTVSSRTALPSGTRRVDRTSTAPKGASSPKAARFDAESVTTPTARARASASSQRSTAARSARVEIGATSCHDAPRRSSSIVRGTPSRPRSCADTASHSTSARVNRRASRHCRGSSSSSMPWSAPSATCGIPPEAGSAWIHARPPGKRRPSATVRTWPLCPSSTVTSGTSSRAATRSASPPSFASGASPSRASAAATSVSIAAPSTLHSKGSNWRHPAASRRQATGGAVPDLTRTTSTDAAVMPPSTRERAIDPD